jgi:hypothetical protein
MKRSIRRHQQQVAKIRKLQILYRGAVTGHSWRAFERPLLYGFTHTERPWRGYHRLTMHEPGWWTHDWHIVPARIRSNRMLHAIERGADPDRFQWPDCKKPQVYYW